ncbi:hypothetical protein [Pseudomonas aeruginosa]|uniref:hypothetical protein n=1 Tax=Pseudomonas aeruginosa TaxID=287 RepID=UPI001F0994EA|nr:hypothetical protein [Pseudomonas aeruginosa]
MLPLPAAGAGATGDTTMSSTQHQLIEQCATRLRGIVEALDNIHDTSPHRWSTDLDDVHSSAESLLALIKDQAPARSEASFEEWLANELEGEDGQPVPAAVCDIALARRAFNHWPKLEQPAKVGGVRFSAGVSSRLVVEAAQRLNEFESTPEQEAERPEMSPERAAYFMRRFKSEEKLLGPNEQAAVDYVLPLLAQHESIVGALRAELESERNRVNIYVNNNGIRQDNERLRAELRAALARVAEQQTEIEWLKNPKALAETVHADAQEAVKLQRLLMDSHTACRPAGEGLMGWAHAALSAQAQHSVPDGAADLCGFLAKLYCELDGLRYSTAKLPAEQIADALIFKWPVLQGARNQLNIKRISEQPYDESKLHSAIAAMLAAAPGNSVPQAWLDVQAERRRQITAEGWTPEHDDEHSHGQMARASACYALAGSSAPNDGTAALLVSLAWPWDEQWWKPSTARRDLVKACALALAEIERLDRACISQSPQPGATTASS